MTISSEQINKLVDFAKELMGADDYENIVNLLVYTTVIQYKGNDNSLEDIIEDVVEAWEIIEKDSIDSLYPDRKH